ncbi:MAG TPA: DUF4240 domain-containing protein [Actinomycetales bacterium]|nr:DUF4240 domain-containing protein [Actinomycetales bacterium]
METDEFWALIDSARDEAKADPARQTELLTRSLSGLAADDIVSFDAHFRSTRARGYTWDLWAVGFLAAGGMSDDAFMDFRAYLIGRGREVWERALEDPDAITDELDWGPNREPAEAIGDSEGLAYAAAQAYEQSTGSEIPALGASDDGSADEPADEPAEPSGLPWNEDRPKDLAERFPQAWARWGSGDETDDED